MHRNTMDFCPATTMLVTVAPPIAGWSSKSSRTSETWISCTAPPLSKCGNGCQIFHQRRLTRRPAISVTITSATTRTRPRSIPQSLAIAPGFRGGSYATRAPRVMDLNWDPDYWLWSDGWCKLTRTEQGVTIHGSHRGSINICYLDGHVKFQGGPS